MTFLYQFRYTFTDDLQIKEDTPEDQRIKIAKAQKSMLYEIYEILKEYIQDDKFTSGIEYRNKRGEFKKNHFHFHFVSINKKDTIAKQFKRRIMEEYNDTRKKSHAYSLIPQGEVNYDKLWRYPIKERDFRETKFYSFCKGFDETELRELNLVAHQQRKVQYEVNQTKQSKKEDVSFVERFCSYLDNSTTSKSHQGIFVALLEFYIQQDKPPNHKQLCDYSYLYMIKKKYISPEEYYNINKV